MSQVHNDIKVTGSDIWKGRVINVVVPRAYADATEKFFGMRDCINDRHTLSVLDTISKIREHQCPHGFLPRVVG